MKLKRIRSIARRAKSENRIRGRAEVRPSINRVEVRDVGAIEKIEQISAELGSDPLIEADFARDAHVKAIEAGPFERVSAQVAWTVREGVAIAIGVRAGEDVKTPAGLSGKQ